MLRRFTTYRENDGQNSVRCPQSPVTMTQPHLVGGHHLSPVSEALYHAPPPPPICTTMSLRTCGWGSC